MYKKQNNNNHSFERKSMNSSTNFPSPAITKSMLKVTAITRRYMEITFRDLSKDPSLDSRVEELRDYLREGFKQIGLEYAFTIYPLYLACRISSNYKMDRVEWGNIWLRLPNTLRNNNQNKEPMMDWATRVIHVGLGTFPPKPVSFMPSSV
jgi:hypothetical protein